MSSIKQIVHRWFPAFVVMSVIFWFSSQPGEAFPVFSWADAIVKKSGHLFGYAMLALSYLFALSMDNKRRWLVWSLVMLYAATDEFHQSFVPGRYASAWDILIFDNIGALFSLWWVNSILNKNDQVRSPDR